MKLDSSPNYGRRDVTANPALLQSTSVAVVRLRVAPLVQTRVYDCSFHTPEVCFASASTHRSLFNTPCQKGDMSFPSVNLSGALASPGNTCFTFAGLMKVIAYPSS